MRASNADQHEDCTEGTDQHDHFSMKQVCPDFIGLIQTG